MVLLYKTSVECSIDSVPFPFQKMQGIFLRNLCMKQKEGRLHSVVCTALFFDADDPEWPPQMLWPYAAEIYFLIQQFGASVDAPNCVFYRKERFYFMIPQKRTAAQVCSSPS